MLSLPLAVKIYLAKGPADMRKGIDGLVGIVMAKGFDIYSGHLFVFLGKRRNMAKIITFDRGGFVLYCKRLERGRFRLPSLDGDTVRLDAAQLTMLLDGMDVLEVKRSKVWEPKNRLDINSAL